MISWYRVAAIAPGKMVSAVGFAHEIAAFVKGKTGVEVRVAMPLGGNPNRIGWSSQHESLASFEIGMSNLIADSKYMEIVAKAADYFIAGSVHDEMWRIL
jgi:hypothetical protein